MQLIDQVRVEMRRAVLSSHDIIVAYLYLNAWALAAATLQSALRLRRNPHSFAFELFRALALFLFNQFFSLFLT